MNIPQGMISLDNEFCKALGFTEDKFYGFSYLWGSPEENRVTVSNVFAKEEGKGFFTSFLRRCAEEGFRVAVPTPSNVMRGLLERRGFTTIWEDTDLDACEVMISPKEEASDA